MLRSQVSLLLILLLIIANVCAAEVAPLSETDFLLKHIPTGEIIMIGKPLSFSPDNAQVYLERRHDTGEEYVGAITIYSKDYLSRRGISVGDSAEIVRANYGEPNRSGSKSEYKWISYIDNQQVLKIHFYLDKESEQVIAIQLSIYPVGTPMMIRLADGKYR